MKIAERIQIAWGLLVVSMRVLATYPLFILYLFLVAALYGGIYTMPGFLTIPLSSLIRTFFSAFIIHQAINLPGGSRPSLSQSFMQCSQHVQLLALWALIEMSALMVFWYIESWIRFITVLVIMIAWYTISVPVIPLIVDNRRTFVQMLQQAWLISKKLWVEACAGMAGLSLAFYTVHTWLIKTLSTFRLPSSAPHFLLVLLILVFFAGLVTLAALFKGLLYRFYDRERQLELSELRSPYF